MSNTKLQFIRSSCGFGGLFSVDPIGRKGGLALFWKDQREVTIVNYSTSHIHAQISMESSESSWTFTDLYGNPDRTRREGS
jgi:hypothetical protein